MHLYIFQNIVGIPIVASQPHFYDAHEDYQNGVRGLNPNAEEHGIYFDIEPVSYYVIWNAR